MCPTLKLTAAALALVATTALVTTHVVLGQDGGDEAAAMAAMMKLATPGPQHAELAKMAGSWDVQYRMRWSPDAPWMDIPGTSEVTPILGGRFMLETVKFSMMGMPMEGVQILGYDNLTGEYTALWADTMSTWWTSSRGKADADGTVDYKGDMTDVAGTRPFRMVVKHTAEGAHIEMFDTIPPQGEVLVMTIDTKRPDGRPGGRPDGDKPAR